MRVGFHASDADYAAWLALESAPRELRGAQLPSYPAVREWVRMPRAIPHMRLPYVALAAAHRRRRGTHIHGPTLCGFWGLFESDYGDPKTPEPYATITPSRVGNSLLPFRCPNCKGVPQALACPKTRAKYCDKRHGRPGNCWCPLCGYRFFLDERGVPLPGDLPAGADVAPSRVERAGAVTWQDAPSVVDSVIGAIFGRRRRARYDALALAVRRRA